MTALSIPSRQVNPGTALLAATHLGQAAVLVTPAGWTHPLLGPSDRPPEWVIRALGLRTFLQGVADLSWHSPAARHTGIGVDCAHAASMLAAALAWPAYRRAALLSASAAVLSAAVGILTSRARTP